MKKNVVMMAVMVMDDKQLKENCTYMRNAGDGVTTAKSDRDEK